VSTALSIPSSARAVVEHPVAPLHLVTAPAADKSEETRWMLGFGLPCLSASLFVAAAIGTGIAWLLGAAILSLGVAILSLTWLAISSDTNS
jgi:hypothetical protein